MSDIIIDLANCTGSIKRLHGVNNGPEGYGTLVDVSHYYKKAQIPLVRLHDPNYPHAWEIDIHTIFPDFSKDPEDPASYEFSRSDAYIQRIVDTGAQILFRLGESIEHTARKYYVFPPADFNKWAQICIGIIRHYNQGWADGYQFGIQYWEIWNETDVTEKMWSGGTFEQYYDLYRTAATAIKRFDPSLKVGGPAAAFARKEMMQGFLKVCEKEQLPLDFCSWHMYADDPEAVRELAFYVRQQLDSHGFTDTESIFDEWSYFEVDLWDVILLQGSEYVRRDMFERGKGVEGASFTAAVLTMLQECPVDHATYYDGQPHALFCGLFDYYGVPQKPYHVLEAFNQLAQYPHKIATTLDQKAQGLYCCAAKNDEGEAAILISNYSGRTRFYEMELQGVSQPLQLEMYILDRERNFQRVDLNWREDGQAALLLPKHSVALLKIKA